MNETSLVKVGKDLDCAIFIEMDEVIGVCQWRHSMVWVQMLFFRKVIEKVYQIKKRSKTNPLIVHVDRIAEVKPLVRHTLLLNYLKKYKMY